jgi:hypothetical protein
MAEDKKKTKAEEALARDPEEKARQRAENLSVSRKVKMDDLYKGKKFTIEKRVDLEGNNVFQTKLGNKGRHGFVIVDNATGEKECVGATMLKVLYEQYKGVTKAQLDEFLPPRKPKAEKKAKAEKPVEPAEAAAT